MKMDKNLQPCLDKLAEALKFTWEPVTRIRAVYDYYRLSGDSSGREYVKEVAEIEYRNGAKVYADIGCDSNLAALYDVLAVLVRKKQRSAAIQRVEYPGKEEEA